MNEEQRKRWDEANEMEEKYGKLDPLVVSTAIQIRAKILKELEKDLGIED